MIFRDISTGNSRNGIEQDVWFLTRSTSASYPTLDVIRNVNEAYKDVSRFIWDVADGWEYDDSNYANLPIAKTNFVNNQPDYSIPSGAQRIHRVQALQGTGSNQWLVIPEADWADVPVAMEQQWNVPGFPVFYKLVGQSLMFYPTPVSGAAGVTLANGLEIFFERDIMQYASGAARPAGTLALSASPGFAAPFHRILSYAAALDYEEDSQRRAEMIARKTLLEKGLQRFYSKRNIDYPTKIKPYGKTRWRKYV